MGMSNYGQFELLANIEEINRYYDLKKYYDDIEDLLEDTGYTPSEIEQGEASDDINKAIKKYIKLVKTKLDIELDIRYISDDADGTDLAGELVWIIDFKIKDKYVQFSKQFETWSYYG